MDRRQEPDALARIPTRYQVGSHEIQVALTSHWAWSCAVDGAPLEGRFETQAEAWESGVRECARRDSDAGR
ncbi:MAG TPA: hypothetical protein VMU15_00655 [Anaeromyxobacter sp.]|nr:hypothetical protein [Anaeromyxobacter sp.]